MPHGVVASRNCLSAIIEWLLRLRLRLLIVIILSGSSRRVRVHQYGLAFSSPVILQRPQPQRQSSSRHRQIQPSQELLPRDQEQKLPQSSHPLQPFFPLRLSHETQRALLLQIADMRRIIMQQEQNADDEEGEENEHRRSILEQGQAARERLITTNMGLVYYVVQQCIQGGGQRGRRQLSRRQPQSQNLLFEECVQEGAIGLARAVDQWNPDIGGKFSTYAVYWIRAAVLRKAKAAFFFSTDTNNPASSMIRIPEYMHNQISKLYKTAAFLGMDTHALFATDSIADDQHEDDELQLQQLAEAAGLSRRQVERAIAVIQQQQLLRRSRSYIIGDMMEELSTTANSNSSPSSPSNVSGRAIQELQLWKTNMAQLLRPRELEALSWRYGLLTASSPEKRIYDYDKNEDPDHVWENAEAEPQPQQQRPIVRNKIHNEVVSVPGLKGGGRWGEAMSFVEVGQQMQVSAEYGRRLVHAALTKLRKAAQDGSLPRPAFLF